MLASRTILFAAVLLLPLLAGCKKSLSGNYSADVRVAAGKAESTQPGYTLADVKKKLQTTYQRSLILNADGTYAETYANRTNHGDWRRIGDTIILNDTDSNGVPILPKLQVERKYRLVDGGREIITGEFGAYNLDFVYTKK